MDAPLLSVREAGSIPFPGEIPSIGEFETDTRSISSPMKMSRTLPGIDIFRLQGRIR